MEYFTVSTNGNGLVVRYIGPNDTTVYCDRWVADFDTWEEADAFARENDHLFYEEEVGPCKY